jgi:hypothetical protein
VGERILGVLYYVAIEDLPADALWQDTAAEDTYWWTWVTASAPFHHHGLETPPIIRRMTQEQIEANTALAMEELYRHISGAKSGS